MKIMAILGNGFEELEAIGSMALLRRSGIEIDVYTLNQNEATGRFNFTLSNLLDLSTCKTKSYDALLLPGGPHYEALEADQRVTSIIQTFAAENKVIAAICAAPTILGKMGLLKGRNYTCFTSMNEDFGGTFHDQYVVCDNNFITGRSAAASIDFGFAIIEKLQGKNQAEIIKKQIYYNR